jgi:hypothetical protein
MLLLSFSLSASYLRPLFSPWFKGYLISPQNPFLPCYVLGHAVALCSCPCFVNLNPHVSISLYRFIYLTVRTYRAMKTFELTNRP